MFETVIGLEIHVQLMTKSKIFSGAATEFGAGANSQASAVDLGLPGVLPVLNIEAVRMAVKFGLAIGAEVNQTSIFARKNYFYPDLPKGYQISQLDLPIVGTGSIEILTGDNSKIIGITRAHLEEDAGKSVHDMSSDWTAIDLNRAGTPLLEIVSEPDLRSATEAVEYAKKIRTLVQYLQICDGNMAEGSMRFDANVSVRPIGQETLGTRTELKNLNSFKFLEQAVNLEVERQIEVLEDGGKIAQETRLYDEKNHQTRPMRSKEEANDYRYFPDPDLLPIVLDDDFLAAINQDLPELPDARKSRFITEFGLNDADALSLTSSKSLADYFEQMTKVASAKLCANWVIGELRFMLNKTDIKLENAPISPLQLAELLSRISDNTISGKIAKDVFRLMWEGHGSADEIIAARGLQQLGDVKAIEAIVDEVIKNHQEQVEQIRSGNKKVLGFLVGQVLKASGGKANPQQANEILNNKI